MSFQHHCSVCGKLCSCKKKGGMCQECNMSHKYTNPLRRCNAGYRMRNQESALG